MDEAVRARLDQMAAEHASLLEQLASGEVASDHTKAAGLGRRLSELDETVKAYGEYRAAAAERDEARELAGGASGEERHYYAAAAEEASGLLAELEQRLVELLTPRDPRDERNVIVEIRAGAGGDEAALFAGELFRMYQRFAERHRYRTEVLDASEADVGGYKEIVFEIRGKGAWSRLKYESGVHRVQRVPATESSGRIHTSTATVAVLPEADEVGTVEIAEDDLKVDTYRSSGPGGQHVNTTDSAVRLTHIPTGLVVACQSERSQRQNRDRATRLLLAKLQERADAEARAELAEARRSQVGTGDRSEKIRTYNFPQNRITDHRIGLTVHNIVQRMDGDIDDVVEALRHADAQPAGA